MGNRDLRQLKEDGSFERIVQRPRATGGGNGAAFAVCASAGDAAAKEVVIHSNFSLTAGAALTVIFAETNTAETPTLSINGGRARPLLWGGTAPAPGELAAAVPWSLTYAAGAWQVTASPLRPHMYNTEDWITESGDWVAPVDGDYDVLLIGGGTGASASATSKLGFAGHGGSYVSDLVHLTVGQVVPVVIGVGGPGTLLANTTEHIGGKTSFGNIETKKFDEAGYSGIPGSGILIGPMIQTGNANGGGIGGGIWTVENGKGQWYGAGGGIYIADANAVPIVGAGAQGAVRIRYHDPAKDNGPADTPAPARARKAVRAAKPVTVNLYDPETGQGSVWREEDAPAKLAEGLVSEEAWLEICAQRAAEAHAAWLVDPENEAERFRLLRRARDARLAATDYLVAPDYLLTSEQKVAVTIYRQALRDLPAKEGAPWDGGGELTPWPETPVGA